MRDAIVACIQIDNKMLLIERAIGRPSAGYWCPVSGKIEPGESQADAVVREVSEEIGLLAYPIKKVAESTTDCGRYRLHWWLVKITAGPITPDPGEIAALKWVTQEELQCLNPMFEEDRAILLRLMHTASEQIAAESE